MNATFPRYCDRCGRPFFEQLVFDHTDLELLETRCEECRRFSPPLSDRWPRWPGTILFPIILACCILAGCTRTENQMPDLTCLIDPIQEIQSQLSQAADLKQTDDSGALSCIQEAVGTARLLEDPLLLVETLIAASAILSDDQQYANYKNELLGEVREIAFEESNDITLEIRLIVARQLADHHIAQNENQQAIQVLASAVSSLDEINNHNDAALLLAEMGTLALDGTSVEGKDEQASFEFWDAALRHAVYASEREVAERVFDAAFEFAELHLPDAIPFLHQQRALALGDQFEDSLGSEEHADPERKVDMVQTIRHLESEYLKARRYAESLQDAHATVQRVALKRSGEIAAQRVPVFPGDFEQPEVTMAVQNATQHAEKLLEELSLLIEFEQTFGHGLED
jgi:hypothetical protein